MPLLKPIHAAVVITVSLSLAACGWQLRSSGPLPPGLQRVQVQSDVAGDDLALSLKNALAAAGVDLVDSVARAQAVIHLDGERLRRAPVSVDLSGKVREYALLIEARFRVSLAGETVMGPQAVRARRDYVYRVDDVLGNEAREQELIESMRDQLSRQILSRLRVLSLTPAEAAP